MPKVSNRQPRVAFSEYHIPKKIKYCAYCKNHDQFYPEKSHKQDCLFNNDAHYLTCRPCNQNHKKTLNVKNWREKKQNNFKNDHNGIGSVNMKDALGNLVEECFIDFDKKFVDEMLDSIKAPESGNNGEEKMEVEEIIENVSATTDVTTLTKELGLTIAILPYNYPENIFTEDVIYDLQSNIENLIDQLTAADQFPRFVSSIYESGYWRVTCVDEFTVNWLINSIVATFTYIVNDAVQLMKIMSINQIQKHVFRANIPEKPLEITNILRMIHKQNGGLDTSRWQVINEKEYSEGFTVTFEVDPLSFKLIKENNFSLCFGMGRLDVTVIDEYKKFQ